MGYSPFDTAIIADHPRTVKYAQFCNIGYTEVTIVAPQRFQGLKNFRSCLYTSYTLFDTGKIAAILSTTCRFCSGVTWVYRPVVIPSEACPSKPWRVLGFIPFSKQQVEKACPHGMIRTTTRYPFRAQQRCDNHNHQWEQRQERKKPSTVLTSISGRTADGFFAF